MTLSPASAAQQRTSSAKLEALLAKLAVRKLELDKAAAEEAASGSESDSSSPSSDADDDTRDPCTRQAAHARRRRVTATSSMYGTKKYWDDRYGAPNAVVGENLKKGEPNNEWYFGWRVLKPYLAAYAPRNARTLLLGCGTSALGEDMASDGFSRITAVDYSEPSIERMRATQQNRTRAFERNEDRKTKPRPADARKTSHEVDYRVMDVTRMTFEDESFECVLDKATLDTMCQMDDDDDDDDDDDIGEASEWATTKKKKKTKPLKISSARRMLLESFRVLRPGGFYVCVTYGPPNDRMEYFLDPDLRWDLTAHREVLKNTTKYHFFAFRKTGGKDPVLDGARLDPAAVIDATSLEVIRIGNSTATIPVLRDPFHGSSLDMRVRRHKR